MTQLLYIFFGWLLGLASPLIVEFYKSKKRAKIFMNATRIELRDLEFRLAFVSYILEQQYGRVTVDHAKWLKKVIDNYEGNELTNNVVESIGRASKLNQEELDAKSEVKPHNEGTASSLKTFQATYLLSNLEDVSKLAPDLQRKFHEFLYDLNILNQEIQKVDSRVAMTFDSSMTELNHERRKIDINNRYVFIAGVCRRTAKKIDVILCNT